VTQTAKIQQNVPVLNLSAKTHAPLVKIWFYMIIPEPKSVSYRNQQISSINYVHQCAVALNNKQTDERESPQSTNHG